MGELTIRERAMVLEALGATTRWLALLSTWLSEQGAEPAAIGLVDQARQDVVAVCHRLERSAPARADDRNRPGGA